MFVGFILLCVAGYASADSSDLETDDQYADAFMRATTLYFHDRMFTKGVEPKAQLKCVNTKPVDGCSQRRVSFAECHRESTGDWRSWKCTGQADDPTLESAHLVLQYRSIHCENASPDSCSLTFTLQHTLEMQKHFAEQDLRRACEALPLSATTAHLMIAATFVLPFLLVFLWFGTLLRYISYLVDIGVFEDHRLRLHVGISLHWEALPARQPEERRPVNWTQWSAYQFNMIVSSIHGVVPVSRRGWPVWSSKRSTRCGKCRACLL